MKEKMMLFIRTVDHIYRLLKKPNYGERIKVGTSIYLAVMIEYLNAEVLYAPPMSQQLLIAFREKKWNVDTIRNGTNIILAAKSQNNGLMDTQNNELMD
ncbi:histone H2A-like [Vespula squamosa]|uniref:Histone H2A-like n=1 Tax=Vespula squamosa TaxID=30214 RepID=A0ABD2BS10_VESSQ